MFFEWLNKNDNKNLIVFFNGWGSIQPAKLAFNNFDVIMFHNYSTLTPINIDFSNYNKKYLIAWSLGVYVCNYYFDKFRNFNGFTAINGTQKPVDDNYGIPVNAYNLTIDNFNELTCKKFIKKTGVVSDITRNINELKEELITIKNLKPSNFLNFNKAVISLKDKIFPYKNMINFWNEKNIEINEIDAPHYVFDLYKNWSDFL